MLFALFGSGQGHPPSALWHGAGLAVLRCTMWSCVSSGDSRRELCELFSEFQLEAAQNAYREASGSQAGTAQTPTRYLKFKAFRIFRTKILNRTAHITYITCYFMWPMLSRYFCWPREVWDPGWNWISNLKHMSLNFSFLEVTFNHWAYRPHRYDVILVAKYNHHHHHDILRYHVPLCIAFIILNFLRCLRGFDPFIFRKLAFLRSRWSPALWSHAQHPPDGQQNSCCWVRVAWNCWNVHGVHGVHGVHDQINFFAFSNFPLKSLRPRSESRFVSFQNADVQRASIVS